WPTARSARCRWWCGSATGRSPPTRSARTCSTGSTPWPRPGSARAATASTLSCARSPTTSTPMRATPTGGSGGSAAAASGREPGMASSSSKGHDDEEVGRGAVQEAGGRGRAARAVGGGAFAPAGGGGSRGGPRGRGGDRRDRAGPAEVAGEERGDDRIGDRIDGRAAREGGAAAGPTSAGAERSGRGRWGGDG